MGWDSPDLCSYAETSPMARHVWWQDCCFCQPEWLHLDSPDGSRHVGVFLRFFLFALAAQRKQGSAVAACGHPGHTGLRLPVHTDCPQEASSPMVAAVCSVHLTASSIIILDSEKVKSNPEYIS